MNSFSRPMAMTERQRRFRETYRANISPFYNGLLHVGVMYAVGISLLVYCFQQLDQATWAWLMVLPDEVPKVMGGLGTNILTTSRGVMTGRDAAKSGVGGEVLCNVW